jgi:MFS family permease
MLRLANASRSAASAPSLRGLDWLNFFIADFQTGFGPFISVYLTGVGWTQGAIGAVLSIGTIAGMASQVPGGMVAGMARDKRAAVGAAIIATLASALFIALWPTFLSIGFTQVLRAFAGSVMGPAVAALSLALVHPNAFGERLGRNARFAAFGTAIAAGLMGACGSYFSDRAVFYLTAAFCLPALAALAAIRRADLERAKPRPTGAQPARPPVAEESWGFLKDRRFVALFVAVCLFHLANAAMLPIAAGIVTKRAGSEAAALIAAGIVGPQIVTALLSPWAGRAAQSWGRRPILILGYSVLPIRGALLASITDPYLIVLIQLLDGLGASVFGVLMPLIVSDITRASSRYTTCLGIVGLAVGGGATLSTTSAGLIADHFGGSAAFGSLAGAGLCATLFVWAFLPETKPDRSTQM